MKDFITERWRKRATIKRALEQGRLQRLLQVMRNHPWIARFWSFFGAIGLFVTLVGGFELFWGGTPWPTGPIIEPDEQVSGSWNDLPINVKNNSAVFPIKNVTISCLTFNYGWNTLDGHFMMMSHKPPVESPVITKTASIAPTGSISFSCDFYRLDSVWALPQKATSWKQIPIVTVTGMVKIKYATDFGIFIWRRSIISAPLTWREVTINGGYQWLMNDNFAAK